MKPPEEKLWDHSVKHRLFDQKLCGNPTISCPFSPSEGWGRGARGATDEGAEKELRIEN
jgi:hypothetical protein